MAHQFAALAFTDSVREMQSAHGSRAGYAAMDEGPDHNHVLTEREAAFITERDSVYMASVSETGWPYVQHRGGPRGFMRVLDERTIGFADFSGNRQYVSLGNVRKDNRVSLFFMDYPNRTRLKLLGRVEIVSLDDHRLEHLEMDDYRARVERGFLIHVEAFDWNCPQHITPRYTDSDIESMMAPLIEENRRLKAESNAARPTMLGEGPLELTVTGVRVLTPRIRAYTLSRPNAEPLPSFEAGAHLELQVPMPDGTMVKRHYSLTSDPSRLDSYEIAVLRDDDGRGGSIAVHDALQIGVTLYTHPPRNNFPLHTDDRPAVLIAGGIGITPIKAMAQSLSVRGTPFELHYAARSARDMAYRHELAIIAGNAMMLYHSDREERLDIARVLKGSAHDAQIYVCGPSGLLDAVTETANELGIDPDRIVSERFSAVSDRPMQPVRVELARTGTQIDVPADRSVLDALIDAGIDAPHSCREGVCGTCAVKVLDGTPDHRDAALPDAQKNKLGIMYPCVSRACGSTLRLDL